MRLIQRSDSIPMDYSITMLGFSSQFATNAYITNLGSSNYHGMLVSLQRRFAHGLKFDLNYTWSHSIDNQSSVANTVFGGLICDLNNLRVCRGNSDFDIRHLVNANWIYELPFGKGRLLGNGVNKWVDGFIGGWTFSGIYTYRSGLPFSTTTGSFPVGFVFDSPGVPIGGNSNVLSGGIHNVPGSAERAIRSSSLGMMRRLWQLSVIPLVVRSVPETIYAGRASGM